MSTVNITGNPYYNNFDPSKEYTMVLARPGYVEQSREFNESQAVTREYLKRISDTVLVEGTIISGCEIIISETDVTISAGKLYLAGLVRDVAESHVTITGVGYETIGALLNQVIITEIEDPTLLDPAEDYENYSMPGAHRLKETISIVSNDTTAQIIYKLQDGALINAATNTEITVINDVLATRTYDEIGNYKVSGLEIQNKNEESEDGTQLKVSVNSGKAYVKGYSVVKQVSNILYIDKAKDTREVIGEPKVYHTGTAKYKLNNSPVALIEEVLAQVSKTQSITRGNTGGGSDLLPLTPVVDITSITAGATTYIKGVDYQLTANSVDWSLAGAEPSSGSTYTCTWTYNKVLVKDTDYKLTSDTTGDYIDFTGMVGTVPVNNSSFTITYPFYLSRQDLVVVDKTGVISVIKGQSDIISRVSCPDYNNVDFFKLGDITILANSNTIYINNNAIQRLPIEKLYAMLQRIEDLEYNDAVNDLDTVAQERESASTLKGILTDSFVNFDKADLTHSLYKSSLDVTDRVLLPEFTRTSIKPTLDTANSTVSKFSSNIIAKASGAGYTVLFNQNNATEAISVNPYAIYTRSATVSISPSATSRVGNVYTSEASNTPITNNIVAYYYYRNSYNYETEVASLAAQGYSVAVNVNNSGDNWRYNDTSSTTVSGTKVTTSIKSRFYWHIPQDTITIYGNNFMPYQDNLVVTFDGIEVSCSATAPYVGTSPGTLKANANGYTTGTFVIPANVVHGTKKVVISGSTSGVQGSTSTVTGSTIFTSSGVVYDTYNTINHVNVVYKPYDPVAQSFSLDESCFIYGVTLYFASKSASSNVTVELRGMENGYPNTTQYAAKVLYPSQVNVSSNGSAETTIVFNDPIYCDGDKQYCIVVESESTEYQVFISTVGKTDVLTGNKVTSQINSGGVLFTSSNALTWTANQNMDLKMKLLSERFNTSAVALFNPITVNANMLYLNADAILSVGCNCVWEYRTDNDITQNANKWYSITPYVETYLSSTISKVQLRARFTGTPIVSPVVNLDLINLDAILFKTSGSYVTKNVVMSQNFTTVKQVVDLSLPSGCTATVQFCTDGNGATEGAWTTATQTGTSTVNTEYTQYTFETTCASATNFRARINLSTANPTVIPKARNFMNIIK